MQQTVYIKHAYILHSFDSKPSSGAFIILFIATVTTRLYFAINVEKDTAGLIRYRNKYLETEQYNI